MLLGRDGQDIQNSKGDGQSEAGRQVVGVRVASKQLLVYNKTHGFGDLTKLLCK